LSKIVRQVPEERPRSRLRVQRFGHPPAVLRFWHRLVRRARRDHPTPFFLFALEPVREALAELATFDRSAPVPVRHWLSCKTQPVRPLLRWWRGQGRDIEVVSEFELQAALAEGFTPERILVNGPAKQRWLPRHARPGLSVNFDSRAEMEALLPLARRRKWRVGIRFLTSEEFDPEHPNHPTQFGFEPEEAVAALRRLVRAGARLEMVHFHLRTNLASPAAYERTINEAAGICRAAAFAPRILDCGGGWPPRHTLSRDGRAFSAGFSPTDLARMYRRVLPQFPALKELWLENGRFVTARSGVLVVRVADVKERRGVRQLLCDGGRTLHALVSNWEQHALFTAPERRGPGCPTAVFGPTCMAFDQPTFRQLPRGIRSGDALVWMEAGAYHIPWETRFSHGRAKVLWHEGRRLRVVREAETFASWWGQWKA
jgi:diaminopimelate decarboxylase